VSQANYALHLILITTNSVLHGSRLANYSKNGFQIYIPCSNPRISPVIQVQFRVSLLVLHSDSQCWFFLFMNRCISSIYVVPQYSCWPPLMVLHCLWVYFWAHTGDAKSVFFGIFAGLFLITKSISNSKGNFPLRTLETIQVTFPDPDFKNQRKRYWGLHG
jgi:hypothetical protein